jgi:alpha-D-ribose 1-methylphosphonate 5-phosphate C-P lyase
MFKLVILEVDFGRRSAGAFLLMVISTDAADTNQAADLRRFGELTLEQLVNVQVTSVSKEKTDLFTRARRHLRHHTGGHPPFRYDEHS